MNILHVNGKAIPNPQEITVSVQDVDYESGRAQDGYMVRDRRRGGTKAVRKVECKFPPLSDADMSHLLKAIDDASFELSYPDPYVGAERSGKFYCGDRTAPMYTMINGVWQWESLSVNFVEF